ncbi:hypothetical protein F5B21DRAFT_121710 [Xylaria acuta]|nr:hypothetical protein F5B21DRAFT_121710 [Xylaria acuta]
MLNAISTIFEIYRPYSLCSGDDLIWVVDPKVARNREEATPRESFAPNPKLNIIRAQWQPANACTGASPEPYENPATWLACSLKALSVAADIWPSHTNANISLKVIERSLWSALWIPSFIQYPETHRISQTFSCIAMFETGDLILPRKELKNVFAMAIRNTIYVAASLLADSGTKCLPCESRMIVGNAGRPGLSMMIPAVDPILRSPKLESWSMINHELLTADSKCTDMFNKTSLHLSFTGFEQPVGSALKRGAQDLAACYLETVVTVFDGSDKVGDLAIPRAIQGNAIVRRLPNSACSHSLRPLQCPPMARRGFLGRTSRDAKAENLHNQSAWKCSISISYLVGP